MHTSRRESIRENRGRGRGGAAAAAHTTSGDRGPSIGPICATERSEEDEEDEGDVSQMNRAGDAQCTKQSLHNRGVGGRAVK
jgi:hypothetical protein